MDTFGKNVYDYLHVYDYPNCDYCCSLRLRLPLNVPAQCIVWTWRGTQISGSRR